MVSSPDKIKDILDKLDGAQQQQFLDKNILISSDGEIPLPLTDDENLRKLRIGIEDLPPDIVNTEDIFEKIEALVPQDEKIAVQFDSPYDLSFDMWQKNLESWNEKYENYNKLDLECKN